MTDTTASDASALPVPDLPGRSALVTGSSRGIGLAIATDRARRGAAVVIAGETLRVDGGLLSAGSA